VFNVQLFGSFNPFRVFKLFNVFNRVQACSRCVAFGLRPPAVPFSHGICGKL